MKKLIVGFILLIVSMIAFGAINFSWVAPSEREDNTPISLSEIAGYNIFCGTEVGVYPIMIPIPDGSSTGTVLENSELPLGTNYCVMTTVDTDSRESQYSNIIVVEMTLEKSPPKPPFIAIGTLVEVTIPIGE